MAPVSLYGFRMGSKLWLTAGEAWQSEALLVLWPLPTCLSLSTARPHTHQAHLVYSVVSVENQN